MSDSKLRETLSFDDENMLMRYLDGESGFFERRAVEGLLKSNPAAQIFVDAQRRISQMANEYSKLLPQVDLWDRVSQRIQQEEHAAIFLGARAKQEPTGVWANFLRRISTPWSVGLSGAVALASALMVTLSPGVRGAGAVLGGVAQESSTSNVQTVALHGRPQLLEDDRSPNVVEVDWMRSDGRVRILHDPNERAPMIWVKRRTTSVAAPARLRSLAELALIKQPTPTFQAMSSIAATE
ncbi:MAG: hypothetical protein K1X79_14375 [Oligoflexia bacterium]|nr:hypothetical protein [Oligoflexia bacterium]